MKDHSDLKSYSDKKVRTLRNNLNNRLEAYRSGSAKTLSPSHMLHGLAEVNCVELLKLVQDELHRRAKSAL